MRSRQGSGWLAWVAALASITACGGVPATPGATVGATVSPDPTSSASPAPSPAASALPGFADDEPLLLFALRTDLGGGIFVSAADGSDRRQLATDVLPGVHKAPDWSPDGQHFVFVDETVGSLLIGHLDGSPTDVIETCLEGVCDHPAWAPDGTRLAFTRYEITDGVTAPSASRIDVLTLETGTVETAIRLERPLLADSPRWSPDGSELVIQVDRMDAEAFETGAAIAVVPAAGGKPRYLTSFETFAGSPDWSRTSHEIVYAVDLQDLQRTSPGDDVAFDLFTVRSDGTGERRITSLPNGGRLHSPRWTPGGATLIAKQFDHMAGGSRLVDPATGAVEPFVFGLDETRPIPRPNVPWPTLEDAR